VIREEVARRRQEYESAGLEPDEMADDPYSEFEQWFAGALAVELYEPSAFVLATASADGLPSARAVLMKDFSEEGLVFYTNLYSRKSHELRANPKAAATFVWAPLHRQVRLEGPVVEVADSEADSYFATRPRGAKIAAHASRQSSVVMGREELEDRFGELSDEFGEEIPRPADWGGWRLRPSIVEFWQGRPNRFHDRVRYRITDAGWLKERLAP
jgi:pyridoxamine 5'-phosphate oxidase